MPYLDFEAKGFADGPLNVRQQLDTVQWDDVFKAAITVGHRDESALTKFGAQSWFEALSRFYRIKLALRGEQCSSILLTPLFEAMDPSEKAVVSYYLGLTFCKLYAERHLRMPWLMHHDVYRKYLASTLSGETRPDLVGLSVDNRWATFEAKGRRRRPSPGAQQRAKEQARSLSIVRGQTVSWSVVSWTCIARRWGVRVLWEDPPSQDADDSSGSLDLSADDLLRHYYAPLIALQDVITTAARTVSDAQRMAGALGISVTLDRELSHFLQQGLYTHAFKYLCDRAEHMTGVAQASDFGLDGVRVRFG